MSDPIDAPMFTCPRCGPLAPEAITSESSRLRPGRDNWSYVFVHVPCGSEVEIVAQERAEAQPDGAS